MAEVALNAQAAAHAANGGPLFDHLVLVTRFFPFPAHTGAYRYSEFLIATLSGLARRVSVVCADRLSGRQSDRPRSAGNVAYLTFSPRRPTLAGRAFTLSPNATLPFVSEQAFLTLRGVISERPDLVVVDHIGASWALRHIPDRMPVIYCTHNDEYLARRSFARAQSTLSAVPHLVDALRIRLRDGALIKRSALVTAISKHDLLTQKRRYRSGAMAHVPPAWLDALPTKLDVGQAPRAVCHFGSLLWEAKRLNLRKFLLANEPKLSAAGIEVIVAGNAEDRHLSEFRQDFPDVQFLGEVDAEADVLRRARIGVLCGEIGGGFRMTALTYAAHGLPIAARPELVEDLGLASKDAFVSFEADSQAADAIIATIDQIDRLQEMGSQVHCRAAELSSVENARATFAAALTEAGGAAK